MTNEEMMQMEEAKLVAEQEAKAVVADERKRMVRTLKDALALPKTDSPVELKRRAEVALVGFEAEAKLKELFNETYKRVLAQELGVEVTE